MKKQKYHLYVDNVFYKSYDFLSEAEQAMYTFQQNGQQAYIQSN
jgi:hypothetical protein